MKEKIQSDQFAKPMGAYSHSYKVDLGHAWMVYTAGQIGLDNEGNVVHADDIEKQTEFVFESLEKILKASGSSLDDAVKAVIYVTDINDFSKISPIRNKYFAKSEPVSTLVEVSKLVKPGCMIEIEVVAVTAK